MININIILSVIFIFIFFCLICKIDNFKNAIQTFDISYLRSPNATQIIIKPINETIFPPNFYSSGLCEYPEQCRNPITLKWGTL